MFDHHLEVEWPNLKLITRLDHARFFDALAVDKRPVLASQIAYDDLVIIDQDRTMAAADGIAARSQMTFFTAADQKLRYGDDDLAAGLRPLHHSQFDLHYHHFL
jgi:hypothetical protein